MSSSPLFEIRPISKAYSSNGEVIVKIVYCDNLNHFFLLDERGRFFLADGNGEVVYGPVTTTDIDEQGGSKQCIDYVHFHNCLLAWDGDKLNVRRDLGGCWLLKTMLAEKRGSIDPDETVAIELTLNEATKLLHYLQSPAFELFSSKQDLLKEVVSNFSSAVDDAREAEKLSRGHKWATVLLRGPFNVLSSLLTGVLTELKQNNLRVPILPVISAVVERLNLLKGGQQQQQQTAALSSFVDSTRAAEATDIEKSLMASESARRLTFSQWPHMDYKWALPDQMAEAGFYHQPNGTGDDRVFCFTCTVCLVCWEPADEPWSEHERHSPTCAFVKGEYTQNVPISVTYASSPALSSGCADKVCCVSKSSYCDWIASSTRYGEIVLWNVAKELKKCDPILLDPSEPFLEMKTGYRCRPRRHLKSSGVAWADETDLLNTSGASPSGIGQDTMREAFETQNEISSEIVATCPQKGDFVVTSVCACGQPASKRTLSETLNPDAKCSPALIFGCGIIEAKLRGSTTTAAEATGTGATDQQRTTIEISSPSSFVENLNTVNKAAWIFNECILPPAAKSCSSPSSSTPLLDDHDQSQSAAAAAAGSSSFTQPARYRPFILVYKVDDAVEERRSVMYASEKSRRTGTGGSTTGVPLQTATVEKNTLASVKEIDECSQSPPPVDEEDLDEDVDDVEAEDYDKEATVNLWGSADDDAIIPPPAGSTTTTTIAWNHPYSSSNTTATTTEQLDDYDPQCVSVFAQPQQKIQEKLLAMQQQAAAEAAGTSVVDAAWSAASVPPGMIVEGSPPTATNITIGPGNNNKTSRKIASSDAPLTEENIGGTDVRPLKAAIAVLQCLRLPSQLDSSLYYVHDLIPSLDGLTVIVVVNKHPEEPSAAPGVTADGGGTTIMSAILLYRLSFSCHMTSLVEQPIRQMLFEADVGLLDSVVQIQSLAIGGDESLAGSLSSNLLVILTKTGDIRVVNVDAGVTMAKCTPPAAGRKYTAVCSFHEDKLCVACDDGSLCTLELVRTDGPTAEAENNTVQSPAEDTNEWKDPDLLVNKPLTLDVLKDLWQLSRSDWATSGQFSMQAPSSWVEVQQHQRLRKNPQHYLREEKLAKSWHLVPDNDTWFEHLFEITLPANFSASHVDFRFVLHHAANSDMPPIQVMLLRQLPTSSSSSRQQQRAGSDAPADIDSTTLFSDLPSTSSAADGEDEQQQQQQRIVKNHVYGKTLQENMLADVIAGPYDLHTALDLYNLNGLIQFSSPELNNSKLRTFYIRVQALNKVGGGGGTNNNNNANKSYNNNSNTGLHKTHSASSAAAMETASAGLYQQKYGTSKTYGIPSGKSASVGSVRVITPRNAPEIRKSDDLRGCDWIQEVSVTVWRTKKTGMRKEKKQRQAMAKNEDFATSLVKALENEPLEGRASAEMDAVACKNYMILDLLTWIVNQGTAESRRLVEIANAMEERLDVLIRSCYIFSNRTVSRKLTALIAFVLSKLKTQEPRALASLADALKYALVRFLFTIDSYRSSASSMWLLSLAEEVFKISPAGCSAFITEMQNFACVVGSILKQRSDACRKAIPAAQRALSAFPFELEMFEIAPPVLTLMQRTQQPFTYAAVTSTGTSVTAQFCSDFAHNENGWLEMVGVDYTPPEGGGVGSSTAKHTRRRGRIVRLEREHLYGLIEVEPLQFLCYSASDGIKIENLDTGVSAPVAGVNNLVPTSTGAGPIPLPDMSQYEQSGNPALTNAVTSMQQQVQSILSKQMQLLAIQQQKQKLQVKLTDHVEKLANLAAEQMPATQASSASTFGVPTTPKTTPFMTPTPLSPHLSPINSEMDLRFDNVNQDANEAEFGSGSGRKNNVVPAEFLKSPPPHALIVDRMSSGARKFLVLSFEQPVLLTDLIIPQCGDVGSLSVDVWLTSESDDGQRLVVCNDISQKTLVLCDLQPPCLCQYLKVTYIGRQGLSSCTSKIPLGNFYGYTYATPSQLLVVDGVSSARSLDELKSLRRPSLSVDQLRQLEEDVRCRYNLACDQLRALLESSVSSPPTDDSREREREALTIEEICREIQSIRMQWNLLHRTGARMNVTTAVRSSTAGALQQHRQAEMICFHKARVISELVLATMIRMSPLMKLDTLAAASPSTPTPVLTPPVSVLTLSTAADLFEQFCNCGVHNLTAMSVLWILHHGAHSNWWGDFFGLILDKFFSSGHDVDRTQRLFLVLSFLVDRGLACGNNAVFLTLMQRLITNIDEDGVSDKNVQWSFQLTLMLLSHSFDSFLHARMVGSRWDFLLGEYSKRRHSPAKGDLDNNGNFLRSGVGKLGYGYAHDAIQQSEDLIAQHHQKVVQLSSELKKIVKSKPSKQSLITKSKSSNTGPYHYLTLNPASSSATVSVGKGNANDSRTMLDSSSSTTTAGKATISSSASSQKKQRLKLPYDLCLSVSRKLASMILHPDPSFSAEIFVLMCKVLSSITRCSRPLLHIKDVFCEPDAIYGLLYKALSSNSVYVRRAVVCLAQDLLASEAKCENARNSTTISKRNNNNGGGAGGSSSLSSSQYGGGVSTAASQATAAGAGSESSGASMESDLEGRGQSVTATAGVAAKSSSTIEKATGADAGETTDILAKKLLKLADDMQATVSNFASSGASASASASTSASASVGATLASMLEQYDASDDVVGYVEGYMDMIVPIPATNSKFSYEKRRQRLQFICRELLLALVANGALTSIQTGKNVIKDYVAGLTQAERNLATSLQTEQQYDAETEKIMSALIMTTNLFNTSSDSSSEKPNKVLASTMTDAADPGPPKLSGGSSSLSTMAGWELVSASSGVGGGSGSMVPPPIMMHPSGQSFASYYSSVASPAPVSGQNLAEAKEALWKLCEQLNASASKISNVYIPGMYDLHNSLNHPSSAPSGGTDAIMLDLGPVSDSMQTAADIPSIWDEDSDSESIQLGDADGAGPLISYFVSSTPTNPPVPAPAHLWKVHETYSAATDSALSIRVSLQPTSLALDERMESQLGWQAEVWIRRWLLENNKRLRLSLQMATCSRAPVTGASSSLSESSRDQRVSHVHTSSAAAVSEAFTRLFDSLSPASKPTYVENLLDTCWLLSIKNDTKTQEVPGVSVAGGGYLKEEAIKKLLTWLLDGIGISEKIWCLAFRLLAASIRTKGSQPSLSLSVIDEPNFPKVLRRLLTKARSSDASELAGPAVTQSFSDLLTCINLHLSVVQRQCADSFREMLVKLLLDLLSERDLRTISQLPLDLLNKLVEFLLNYTSVWRLNRRLVIDFANSLSLNLLSYFLSCDPSTEALLANGAANPRYCFLVGKPDLTTNEFRCFHDRLDVVMVNLLKLGDKLLSCAAVDASSGASTAVGSSSSTTITSNTTSGEGLTDDAKAGVVPEDESNISPIARMLFERGSSSFMDNMLNAIGLCSAGLTARTEETTPRDIENIPPVAAADAAVQWLFSVVAKVPNTHLGDVLSATVDFLRSSASPPEVSDLSVYVLLKIFEICASRNPTAFNQAYVVTAAAQPLLKCFDVGSPVAEYSHLLKSAAAVCGRGPRPTDSTAKKLSEVKVDGMTNFAPLCSISSSSPMAHHLNSLLNSTPPHRRARSAAWSYHFYPAETWLDITLTLPYAVILKEIQVRPHLASLQSSPSAVQVELSPDNNPNSFRGLAPPMITAGCTKIRVSTESFRSPVRMVRLHFKRPIDSTNFGMSQILLLGNTPLSSELMIFDERARALHLLYRTLKLMRRSFFKPPGQVSSMSATLCSNLVAVLLSVPLNAVSYGELVDLLATLAAGIGHENAQWGFECLLNRVGDPDCAYRTDSLPWLAEAVSRLCERELDGSEFRVNMLVKWVLDCLKGYLSGRRISLPLLCCVVWSCACVLWRWGKSGDARKITIQLELITILQKCSRSSNDVGLSKACGYMLCSIVRAYPQYLDEILRSCGLEIFASPEVGAVVKSEESSTSSLKKGADLRILSAVAQDNFVVRELESRGVLSYFAHALTSMCVECDPNLDLMVSMVEFLRDISTQPFVKTWINGSDGSMFLEPLLMYVSLCPLRSSAPMDAWHRLESGTISFLRRCISCHPGSQRLVSTLIAQLLTKINGGLNSSLQQLILRVLLEDEKLTVAVENEKVIRNDFQMHHPQFGCGIHTVVREISVYAICAQLLPDYNSSKLLKNMKKVVSYGAPCSPPKSPPSVYNTGGDSLSDVTFAGEKAKAKRLMTGKKSATGGDPKVDAANKAGTVAAYYALCPIAYLSHPYFGISNPLPGKLTIGQLYWQLVSNGGEDADSLLMQVRYGLPSEANICANEGLLQSATIPSTLEVFARQGGLALLAQHLQLYQPTVSVHNLRIGAGTYADNQMKILEDMQASANKPFLNEAEAMDYYDPSYEWVNVASTGAEVAYIGESKSQIGGAGCTRNVVSTGLSPHVVVCFGVFLRLPGYAELLVTQDRRQAQWLLRLAMGVTTDALGVNIVTNSESASMGILPFEILSSLYWSNPWTGDDGRLIRVTSVDLGIPQLLLRCLAAFSHQAERRSTPIEEKPEVVRVVDQLLGALSCMDQPSVSQQQQPSADDKSHLYWAKGTGFGTGSTQQHWNVDLHIVKQKQDEQGVACLLKVLAQFVYPGEIADKRTPSSSVDIAGPSTSGAGASTSGAAQQGGAFAHWGHFVRLISESCLVPTLQSYLRNDSVLDISRHVAVYESVMRMLCSLALCPQLSSLLTELGDEQQSLRSLLLKMQDCVDIYISKLEPLKKSAAGVGSEDAATEEGLLKLVPLIEQTTRLVQVHKGDTDSDDHGTKGHRASTSVGLTGLLTVEERYMRVMRPLQFDSFKFLREGVKDIRFAIPYHYEASVQGAAKDIGALAPCVRRLAQEAVTLSTSLPLSYNSSVFVRTAEERLDVMKVLISGPSDTPYANGCFEFDVWFPTDYPNSPMHINLQTTGDGTVRFNPNLYNDGKVCLSILNTWHGRPEERWNAQTSSFLQVLVSIQSLILVSEPYFNEPGYERSRGTPAGQHASREYDANIRQATVRWGMLEMIRNPPACFQTVIHRHFWLKRDEITKMIEGWISEMESGGSAGTDKRFQRNLVAHLAALKNYFTALKEEFAKMSHPEGLDEDSTSESTNEPGIGRNKSSD